ncbi:MAG: DUF5050 domain-containing protein [Acutalibacteraceae bacterium]
MSEAKENKRIYKYASWALVLILIAVIGGLVGYILVGPYDPGTLSVTGSCGNLSNGGYLNQYMSYSTYYAEGDSMYCIDSEGNTTIVLDDKNISHINADRNYIYYLTDGKIFSIHNKLTKKQLCDTKATAMSVNGGWIYFTDENGDLYKTATDGKYLRRVGTVNVTGSFAVDNGYVYYTNGSNLYKIRANGIESTKVLLADDAEGYFCYLDNTIFYETVGGEIWSVSAEDGGTKMKREESSLFNYSYNILAFLDSDNILRVKNYTEDSEYYCDDFGDFKPGGIFVTSSGDIYLMKGENEELIKAELVKKISE